MITLAAYWKQKFLNKDVIVNVSDLKQIKGNLERIYKDGVLIRPYKKKSPVTIPIKSILTMEEHER